MGIFEERYKKEKNQKTTAAGKASAASGYHGFSERYVQEHGATSDIYSRMENLLARAENESSAYRSQNSGKGYISDSFERMRTASASKKSYEDEANELRTLIARNSGVLGRERADELMAALRGGSQAYQTMRNDAVSKHSVMSQFEDENEFTAYQKKQEEYAVEQERRKSLLGMDVTAGETALKDLRSAYDEASSIRKQLEQYQSDPLIMLNQRDKVSALQGRLDEITKQYGDVDAVGRSVNQQQTDLSEAKRLQDQQKLSAIGDPASEDYNPLTSIYAKKDTQDADVQYRYINDENFRREYRALIQRGAEGTVYDNFAEAGLDLLNENERGIYNYYYIREGKEKAQEYLSSIQETLNARKAQEIHNDLDVEGNDVFNTALKMVFGVQAGVDQWQSGARGALDMLAGNDSYVPASAKQMASGMVREDLADVGVKLPEQLGGGSLAQMGYDAITSTANMAPSILSSMAMNILAPGSGQIVGTAMMGASAAGSAYQDALNKGYDKNQARGYALLVGGSEAVLGYALSGIGALGGKLSNQVIAGFLDKVDNAFLRTAGKIGGNMLSEFSEEYLQEVLTPVFSNLMLGTEEDVSLFSAEALYSGLLGALTAGIMEGPSTISGEVDVYNQGRNLLDSGVSAKRLAEIGKTFSADTVAYQLAGKVDENTGAYTIGRLFNEIGAEITELNKADIQKSLERKGVSEKDAQTLAESFAAVVAGAKFTDTQMAASDASRTSQNLPGQENVTSEGNLSDMENEPSQNGYEASADGKTIIKSSGKTANIREIASIQDGKMTLRMDDGSEVDANEVAYASEDEALIYETVASMDVHAAAANVLVNAYFPESGVDASVYAHGIKEAYRYGQYNFPMQEAAQGPFSSMLTEYQRNTAYKLGQIFSGKQVAKEQATVSKKENVATTEKSSAVGKVHFDRNGRSFDAVRETSLKTMEQLSAVLDVDFHVFESYENESGERVYKDENGNEVHAPNGFYDPENGSIHIDLNAGKDGKGTMLFTVAHELTHFIKQWSPAKFKVMANFLMQEYGNQGVSVDDLVHNQIRRAEQNGRTLSYDEAFEEVVADSMETMLTDGNVVQMMADLKQQDKSLWQKICDWFKNLVADLRAVVEAYKNHKPDTMEGRMVASMEDVIVTLEAIYGDALVDASENYHKAEKNTAEDGGVKMQLRSANGNPVVWINENILNENDGEPTHQFIANYIAEHIGEVYTIIESGQKVYIGEDLPGEYTQSKYTQAILKNRSSALKAKNRAAANLGEMIEIATNRRWERTKHAHSKDAKYGIYRYDTRFGFPVKNHRGEITGANVYSAELLIRNASDGKKYLYDVVSIKKDTASSGWLTQRVTSAAGKSAGQMGVVSGNSIRNPSKNVNKKFSDRDGSNSAAVSHFGKTFNWNETGYLLTSGTRLDFSGRHEGASGGYRSVDHRNILDIYPEDTELDGNGAMIDFMSRGNIRVMPECNGINLQIAPTKAQEQSLDYFISKVRGEVILDIDDAKGNTVISVEYPRGTRSTKVIQDIRNYFSDGTKPAVSELSRFRYSDRDPAMEKMNRVLQQENAKLKNDVSYLKQMVKLQRSITNGTKFTRSSVNAAAGYLMKYANAKGSREELMIHLNNLYEYIARNEELTWEGVVEKAQPAVEWLQEHVAAKQQRDSYAAEVLQEIRTSRIYLDENQKKEAAYLYGSYNNYRKRTMGSFVIADKGSVSLDTRWAELSGMYPNIFDPNTTSTDMPRALMDAVDTLRNIGAIESWYDIGMMQQDLLNQVYDSYWRVSTLYTVADVKQKEISRLKFAHSERMKQLRDFHKEKVASLKAEHRAELQQVKTKMQMKSEAKQQEIIKRYQESRKQGVESRKKTAMRHKVQNVVKELNQYLLKGTKEKHVPIELQKAVAEALEAVNMDTVGAEERVAKYNELIAKEKNPEVKAALIETRDRIQNQGDRMSERLKALRDAYNEYTESEDPLVANAHDEVIADKMDEVIQKVGNTPLREMTLEQLEAVYDMYRMVLTTIRNANKAFKEAKGKTITQMGEAVMGEVESVGGKKKLSPAAVEAFKKFGWNNMKPIYAFEHIGSETLSRLFANVRAGEDVWAKDVTDARGYYLDKSKKYKYDSWDFKKQYTFTSASGMDFNLNLEQIMSLYAYSKREQAAEHLRRGGIVIDETTEVTVKTKLGIPLKFNPTEATAYNITPETLGDIVSKLTEEQRGFVDEMQDYLSTTMGEKGNEVSLQLYGIKLFKEKYYFPLKSATQFMAKAKEQQKGEVKIKNSGFSKQTVKKANNPIVLTPFMNVWSDHVNEMSMYHAFVLPLEDFNRVYGYKTATSDTAETRSVESRIQNAYGKGATGYIDQLLKDLNGGARTDPTAGIINKGMAMFKKGAVFASLSVVVQQPCAIARAAALVETKYFIGPKVDHKKHKVLWDEIKQYAPVAIIKEMGYFDTNMGKSTQDFILGKEYSGIAEKMKALVTDGDYRDEILSKAPALADEMAWCSIWEAVKRETKVKNPGMDIKSEEFLKKAGERFTEVITKTQVYDSVLSRSANMRSKDTGMKMATAFMGEPTTAINMVADALLKGKRGDRKYCRTAIGSVIASQILNSILVSFVYAARDDDEDETYWEKYIGSVVGEVLDGLNPATYIPFIKDIVSIVQGYDVERSDMAVISDLWNAYQKLDSDKVSTWSKVESFGGSIAQIFGLPVKNIMRDVRGIYQAVNSFRSGLKTTKAGIGYAVKSAAPKWLGGGDVSNQQQLYEAILAGDTAQIARVKARYKDESSINSAIRKALRENDPRIREAAEARIAGDLDEYMRIAKEIIAEKHFTQDEVVLAIKAEINALNTGETVSTSAQKASGLFETSDFAAAIAQGDNAMANTVKEDIIQIAQKNGKSAEEAEKSFNSSASSACKELFMEGEISEDDAIRALVDYCGAEQEDAEQRVGEWMFKAEYGFDYFDRGEAYKNGEISADELRNVLVSIGGKSEEDAALTVKIYDWQKEGYDIDIGQKGVVENYENFCVPVGIDKETFFDVYLFQADAGEEGVSYSKAKECMPYIDNLPLSAEQKTALALCWWAESTVRKYKTW